jgi:short-subunit dehydrogenase
MDGVSRLAAITGASSGIGETFARKLAARGWDLILIARRRDKLEHLAAEIRIQHSVEVEVLAADLCDAAQLEGTAARLKVEERLALLINNAGFGIPGNFVGSALDGQMRMHQLHVTATLQLTHAVLPGMVRRHKGGIINVGSVAGFVHSPGSLSYCATKAWINDFTEGLRLDLDALGSPVVVQALCPGFTYSEFHDVAGIDRGQIAKGLWMSSDFVVEESLHGLENGKLFVIPGWKYKLMTGFVGALPRSWRVAMEKRIPQRKGKAG